MKIAHLIMAHQNPLQLERLVKSLNHPNFDIYIHLDKKTDISDFEYIKNSRNVIFLKNRIKCNWGGFSFVKAITISIRKILEQPEDYEFINLLSAQDYPIKPMHFFYEFLLNHRGKSFISYDTSNESDWWKEAVTRYELYHFTDFNIKGRYIAQKILNIIMPKRNFPLPYKLYGSSNSSWWVLNRDCAQYVANFLKNNPKLLRFMRFTWGSDEFLYSTIIMNSDFRGKILNNNLRYIEWEDGKANPKILNYTNLESLKNSEHIFARKFDISIDTEIMNELDKFIHP